MGWRNAGANQLIYRPNYMLAGANMPINTARRIASDIGFAARNGMMAISQDSLTGVWSAQALQNYVVTRLMREPELGYEKALDEFVSAFGPAAKEMKAYCSFLEDVGNGLSVEDWQELGQKNKCPRGNAGGGFMNFVLVSADIYSENWYDKAESLLSRAKSKAVRAGAAGEKAAKRVDFMLKGLKEAVKFEIVTDQPDALAKEIMEQLQHGVTEIAATGSFTKQNKTLLICVVNKHQIVKFQRILDRFPGSFAYLHTVKETMGHFDNVE
jgi:uncharacterized protein YaaQ